MLTKRQREAKRLGADHIGASQIPDICGAGYNGPSGPADVQYNILGLASPFTGNAATRVGVILENGAIDEAERVVGKVRRGGERVDHALTVGGHKILRVHPDATVLSTSRPLEAKTSGIVGPTNDEWGEDGTDEVPIFVRLQCHGQMMAMDADGCHVAAILGGRGFTMFYIPRDDELVDAIRARLVQFWTDYIVPYRERGELIVPPVVPSMDTLKRVSRVAGLSVDIPDDVVAEYDEANQRASAARKSIKEVEAALDVAKRRVITALGHAEQGVTPSGRLVTFKAVDVKARDAYSYRKLAVKK